MGVFLFVVSINKTHMYVILAPPCSSKCSIPIILLLKDIHRVWFVAILVYFDSSVVSRALVWRKPEKLLLLYLISIKIKHY